MNVLIAFATTEGQTRKISQFCADHLSRNGHQTELIQVTGTETVDVSRFDAAILAASVHLGNYQPAMSAFAQSHATALAELNTVFLAVSLSAAGDDTKERAELDAIFNRFSSSTGFNPNTVSQIAGAFKFSRYGVFKTWLLRWVAYVKGQEIDAGQDKEYTDWDDLQKLLEAWI